MIRHPKARQDNTLSSLDDVIMTRLEVERMKERFVYLKTYNC